MAAGVNSRQGTPLTPDPRVSRDLGTASASSPVTELGEMGWLEKTRGGNGLS